MRAFIAGALLACSTTAMAVPISDPHDIDSDHSVGYTTFEVTGAGIFDILANNTAGDIDPYLYLFRDDGNLGEDDYIAHNDDRGWWTYNSLINRLSLGLGHYVAAVSDYTFSRDEAVAGYNPYITPGTINVIVRADRRDPGGASARLTVPEPGSVALLGMGLLAAGFVGRRSRRKG